MNQTTKTNQQTKLAQALITNRLTEEDLIHLVHAYDVHVHSTEYKENPLAMIDYLNSEEYQELIESGDIYDLLDYEADIEDASVEDLRRLALEFAERVELIRSKNETNWPQLDWLIEELEIGLCLTEEEERETKAFHEKLQAFGYLKNDKGVLTHAEKPVKDSFNFMWEDSSLVCELLKKYEGQIHVCTIVDGTGRFLLVSEGYRLANRLGYILSSQPLLNPDEIVVF